MRPRGITLGFQCDQDGWICLVFDTRPNAEPDGEWNSYIKKPNVFNRPQFTAIDTVVNSPTFGRVISVGAMRSVLMTARFRF